MSEFSWPAPFGYSIFCEDLRQEINGKYSLMGIYNGDMIIFAPFPAMLPSFCIVVHYNEEPDQLGRYPLELMVFLPGDGDDAPTYRQPIPVELPPEGFPTGEGNERRALMMPLQFAPFGLKQEGVIKVRIKRGEDIVRLGSLRVVHRPISQALI